MVAWNWSDAKEDPASVSDAIAPGWRRFPGPVDPDRLPVANADDLAALQRDFLYRQVHQLLTANDWQAAEGLLLRLRQTHSARLMLQVDALLGYTLSMQAAHDEAWLVLEPLLQHPQRTFWVAHLAADCQRGLGEWKRAVSLYHQALDDGSDSPLTVRNLVQVLLQLDPQLALRQLRQWQHEGGLQGAVLEGTQQALDAVVTPELDRWLDQQGLAGPLQQRRLLRSDLRQLDLEQVRERLARFQANGQADGVGDADHHAIDRLWLQAAAARLQRLGLIGQS
jgi:hypothetical protein